MEVGNFENDLHYALSNVGISDSSLLSSCLYTNSDNTRELSTIKLVSAITNHKKKSNHEDANTSIFVYENNANVVSLNDWENLEYFTPLFPSLFPYGIRGYDYWWF